ncbi:MAG: S1C family serine protease [Terriglobia bacterium]
MASPVTPQTIANPADQEGAGQAAKIFALAAPSVVKVETFDRTGATLLDTGSGAVLTPSHVVTNKHVVERGFSVRVTYYGRILPARLAHVHPDLDLCQLSVESLRAPAVPLRDAAGLAVGERVYAIGAPLGFDLTISDGLVSGLRVLNGVNMIQTTAPISGGSSGGGLFDAEGKLVGIITCHMKSGQNLNFAIPAKLAAKLAQYPVTVQTGRFEVAAVPTHLDQAGLVLARLNVGFPSARFEVRAEKDYVIHVAWQGAPSDEQVREYLRSLILRRELPNPEFDFHWK